MAVELPSPNIDEAALRRGRLGRLQAELCRHDCAAAVLFDPCNVRYATGSRNMAVWTLHNHVRYTFVPADGLPVLFEFGAGRWPVAAEAIEIVGEVRPSAGWTHFFHGDRKELAVLDWAAEIAELSRAAGGHRPRVAFDHLDPPGLRAIEAEGIEVADGEALLERVRMVKTPEEIACLRRAVAVAQVGMRRMRGLVRPGLSENELWAILAHANAEHGGEWMETRLLSSGPRTNPWMQEAGERVVEDGDLIAFDTDMVGPFGYCADISRTVRCGEGSGSDAQRRLYAASVEQLEHNLALFRPGTTLREIGEREWPFPEAYLPYRYGVAHGVGLKDEFPFVWNKVDGANQGYPDLPLVPGMVLAVESYIGEVGGTEGVKMEHQILVTEGAPEVLSDFGYEERLL